MAEARSRSCGAGEPARWRRASSRSIVGDAARPAGGAAHERSPPVPAEPGSRRDPRHERAALGAGHRDPDARFGVVGEGPASRRSGLVRRPALPPRSAARGARRDDELPHRVGAQRAAQGALRPQPPARRDRLRGARRRAWLTFVPVRARDDGVRRRGGARAARAADALARAGAGGCDRVLARVPRRALLDRRARRRGARPGDRAGGVVVAAAGVTRARRRPRELARPAESRRHAGAPGTRAAGAPHASARRRRARPASRGSCRAPRRAGSGRRRSSA